MSLSLGEKLRQAREERGFTLSEVAEQTRISSLYLESIENDDYRILPGGIFNKGFVKSYAKHVGINEQEALMDYSRLMAETQGPDAEEVKTYRPEVLTDDRSSGSMPTIIMAIVILGLMTAGVLFLLNYLRQPAEVPAANVALKTNTNAATETPTPEDTAKAPELAAAKIEFSALGEPVSVIATTDGKSASSVVAAGSTVEFTPKESLKLAYYRTLAPFVKLVINGKDITLPSAPLNPKRSVIEFEINNENLARIWTAGSIVTDTPPAATDTNVNTATPVPSSTVPAAATPATRPTAVQTAPTIRPPVSTPPAPARTPQRTPNVRPTSAPPANR